MILNPINFSLDDLNSLTRVCSLNYYVSLDPKLLPFSHPIELGQKSIKAVVVGSGDSTNAVYMVNFLRPDQPDMAVDQEPLIVTYHNGSQGVELSAGIIHHGNWPGRTVSVGSGFFAAIEGSGIMQYYPYIGVPIKNSGSFDELNPDSHKYAFWEGVRAIGVKGPAP